MKLKMPNKLKQTANQGILLLESLLCSYFNQYNFLSSGLACPIALSRFVSIFKFPAFISFLTFFVIFL